VVQKKGGVLLVRRKLAGGNQPAMKKGRGKQSTPRYGPKNKASPDKNRGEN